MVRVVRLVRVYFREPLLNYFYFSDEKRNLPWTVKEWCVFSIGNQPASLLTSGVRSLDLTTVVHWFVHFNLDCKTVVFFALVCQTNARGLWTKGLERVWKRECNWGETLKNTANSAIMIIMWLISNACIFEALVCGKKYYWSFGVSRTHNQGYKANTEIAHSA